MLEVTVTGWSIDLDRGPDCLLVRLAPEGDGTPDSSGLAAMLDELLRLEFAHSIVVDLRDVPWISSPLVHELHELHGLVTGRGGLMRLVGLNVDNERTMKSMPANVQIPLYATLEDALHGLCPNKPR